MIGVIKSSFAQHLKSFSLSASDDLQNLWWRQLLVTASEEVLLMTSTSLELLVFRTSFLQHKHPSCWFHCSHFFFQNLCLIQRHKILSMVLHTWTNISISDWQFLIPCYHKNLKGNVKHILFQQRKPMMSISQKHGVSHNKKMS